MRSITLTVLPTDRSGYSPAATLRRTMLSAEPPFEPVDLLVAERVAALEVDCRAVGLDDLAMDRLARHGRQAEHVDAVVLADRVVGGRVGERQRHETLLLGVRLMDAGE